VPFWMPTARWRPSGLNSTQWVWPVLPKTKTRTSSPGVATSQSRAVPSRLVEAIVGDLGHNISPAPRIVPVPGPR
jgi:hypothetical protein